MKQRYQIICIDDDEHFTKSLASSLPGNVAPLCEEFECSFEFVTTVDELHEVLPASPDAPELAMLISDQMMVGITGVELMETIKAKYPKIMCVLLTGHVAPDSVKYAVNRHLLDQYVSKPIEDIDVFASMLANLLKRYHINQEENTRTEQLARAVTQLRKSNDNISSMLATTKNIAALAMDLKSLEYDKVVEMGSQGAARIFKAKRCVLRLDPGDCAQHDGDGEPGECADSDLLASLIATNGACGDVIVVPNDVLAAHSKSGNCAPTIVIPLCSPASSNDSGISVQGYLCMYETDPSVIASLELLKYSASLVRDILSASLANAKLYKRVKNNSEIDYLTETKSRRVLDAMLEAEYERSLRYNHTFCVMIIDIDHFKTINDRHGHLAGDRILHGLAEVLQGELRASDLLARYGGDEFAVLMPQADLPGAIDAAERMRNSVSSKLIIDGQAITISCGVAEWTGVRDETIAGVLRRADTALYQAKQGGRNRVELAKV